MVKNKIYQYDNSVIMKVIFWPRDDSEFHIIYIINLAYSKNF